MNTKNLFLVGMLATCLGFSVTSRADDIDIYSNITASGDLPNVMIVLDSSANFNGNAPPCTFIDSATTPGYNTKAGGIEQCALNNVIYNLPVNTVNIGVMIYNANVLNGLFPQCNSSGNGGCLLIPLTKISAAGKTSVLAKIKAWGTSNATQIDSSNESDASAMQETWAYFAGKTGMSGTTYTSPAVAGCQKNFVIFIGNAFTNSAHIGDNNQSPGASLNSTIAANTALTATQKTTFGKTISIPGGSYGSSTVSCGTFSMPATHGDSTGYYQDEWSRYMFGTDLSSGAVPATRNITTYTIGVLGSGCNPEWPALLKSTADNGGGKYFATSSYNEVAQAILQILNEVQAVNSVFSSSSLPVSVNTQGTYLNQIYMGMFRPDGSGNPRWLGNLKQYNFKFDSINQSLYLADAAGKQAISSAGTGFIGSNAASFWTCTNTPSNTSSPFVTATNMLYDSKLAALPTCLNNVDPLNGFWASNNNYNQLSAGLSWDLMDGEIVEKGGTAQILRGENMTNDYTTTAGTTTNPRRLYTYCPSGTGCIADLTNPDNAFSTSNANINSSMFGSGGTIKINSIVRNGLVATATTSGAHGLVSGNTVTITNSGNYDGLKTISNTTTTTFDFAAPEYPPQTASGQYTVTPTSISAVAISNATRTAAGLNAKATTTVTLGSTLVNGHQLINGDLVAINGAVPGDYNGNPVAVAGVTSTTFDYPVPVLPPASASASSSYTIQLANNSAISVSSIVCPKRGTAATVTTSVSMSFVAGEYITIAGNSVANGAVIINSIISNTSFTFLNNCGGGGWSGIGGTAKPGPSSAQTLTSLTRNETAVGTATVTATYTQTPYLSASVGYFTNGDTVNITAAQTNPASESAYAASNAVISCTAPCTTFTYNINTTPGLPTWSGMKVDNVSILPVPISLSRSYPSGTTATGIMSSGTLVDGSSVNINAVGATPPTETAYLGTGTWTVTCVGASPCSTFTYGPLTLTPGNSSSTNIIGISPSAIIDKNVLINWIRGMDNMGDETSLCPGGVSATSSNKITGANYTNCTTPVTTVRPSIHGDVLHSRPITVNYGGSTGVVVYYASNDGIYHAVNGNQHTFINSSTGATVTDNKAGQELWGFTPPDFFAKFQRQRLNVPMLQLPSTPSGILPTPQKKDYFADGPTGLYQYINADTTTQTAYLYVGMRRGGPILYALDVSVPSTPRFMWKITNASPGFNELAQTWSLPRVAMVKGYPNPLVFFGGGYDAGPEDAEPPLTSGSGRVIYAVDYLTGDLVWRASPNPSNGCSSSQCELQVSGMNRSIPADVTLMDRDGDGKIDRLYASDMGGNVWRVDFEPSGGITPNYWQVTKLAALGCDTGTCASGTTPRKFFFPPEVIPASSTSNYDAVIVGSGDREHPLITQGAYNVVNRLYMLQDRVTGKDAATQTTITEQAGTTSNLYDCTTNCTSTAPYAGQNFGYYITLRTGEKSVNAPLAAAGYVYLGTNQPSVADNLTCSTDLGIARGYQLVPFGGYAKFTEFSGGGLPPSPVAGVVNIVDDNGETKQVPFLIGGGNPDCKTGTDCSSALGGQKPPIKVSTKRTKTYWYQEGK